MTERKEETYMQEVARHEFEKFEEVSDSFYEMIDSLHRLGDIHFMEKLKEMRKDMDTELIDGTKFRNPKKAYGYINSPNNVIKIMRKLDDINKIILTKSLICGPKWFIILTKSLICGPKWF